MLVIVEGSESVGKSTLSKMLAGRLSASWGAFPDRSTPIGKLIDGHLKGEWGAQYSPLHDPALSVVSVAGQKHWVGPAWLNPMVLQGLMLANRVERLSFIRTAAHRDVVLDRYWPSAYAYGKADGLSGEDQITANSDLPQASLSILLDVPVEISVSRTTARGGVAERYDGDIEKLSRIRENYLELWARFAANDPDRWVVIDATRDLGMVLHDMETAVVEARGGHNESGGGT